jgi:outer membrane protein assembly factor BamB
VAVAGDRIFTAGMKGKQTYVTALDLSGTIMWSRPNGASWEASDRQPWAVPYAGSRSTPTVDGDTVYHLSELGQLTAFDVRTGETRWHTDVLKVFRGDRPKYGLSESVLIHGDVLFCCPAGRDGYCVALDKRTGSTRWTNTDIADPVGYSSPIVAPIDGVAQVLNLSAQRVFSLNPKTGSLVWQYPFGNQRGNNATDVVVHDGLVYASSGYGKGSVLLRPQRHSSGGFAVRPVWTSDLLDNHHGGVVLLAGHLYGAGHQARGWFCLDFKTGQKRWQASGKGSLTYADGRLYCLDEKGTMSLVRAIPERWDSVSSFEVPRGGRGLYWAHPVVCGGRLYVRHADQLFAYRIRGR